MTEEYLVEKDGIKLDEQELSYFENYLQSIIPPDLFEFFLFDGEEVGNIFSTSAYNTYVKMLFLHCVEWMCLKLLESTHMVMYQKMIQTRIIMRLKNMSVQKEIESMESEKEHLEIDVSELTKDLEDVEVQLTELETSFKNAGGISRKEKNNLRTSITRLKNQDGNFDKY